MLRIKVRRIREGLHPNEMVVGFNTADGTEEALVVDRRSIRGDTIRVGYPVGSEPNRLLVELPRETLRGNRRVWVSPNTVVQDEAA
jgi:hypothetical protein